MSDVAPHDEIRVTATGQPISPRRTRWTLGLLTLLYFFYMLDRNAIVVTQELVKREFGLSDTQVGFAIGTVYGISYGLAGLPMGWLADRVNRRTMLVAILSVWSGLTALCSVSGAFWHLVAARIGVAVSEAGGAPASLSILSDLYRPARRATVASIFFTGSGLGVCVGFFAGGLIAREFGWRAVFLTYGLPGLVLAMLVAVIIREPLRRAAASTVRASNAGLLRTTAMLLADRVLLRVYVAATLYCLSTAGVLGWIVAFLMRRFELDIATAGTIIAATIGGGSIVGGVVIGLLADHARSWRRGGPLLVVAVAALVNLISGVVAVNAAGLPQAIVAMFFYGMTVFAYAGPTNAIISEIAPAGSRGAAFALYALLANLVGSGLGPIAVGMLSDAAPGRGGLGPVLQIMLFIDLLAAIAYVAAARAARHRLTLPNAETAVSVSP